MTRLRRTFIALSVAALMAVGVASPSLAAVTVACRYVNGALLTVTLGLPAAVTLQQMPQSGWVYFGASCST